MLEVKKVNKNFEQCLNCKKPVDKEVVISYGRYHTPIQLCEECLRNSLKMLSENNDCETAQKTTA